MKNVIQNTPDREAKSSNGPAGSEFGTSAPAGARVATASGDRVGPAGPNPPPPARAAPAPESRGAVGAGEVGTTRPWAQDGTLIWAPEAKATIAQASELRATNFVQYSRPEIWSPDFAEICANAALIVRAVNSHDELLAALKAMEAFVTDGYETQAKRMAGRKALIASRLAIARAEGERGE